MRLMSIKRATKELRHSVHIGRENTPTQYLARTGQGKTFAGMACADVRGETALLRGTVEMFTTFTPQVLS